MKLFRQKPLKDRPFPRFAFDYFDQLRKLYELLLAHLGQPAPEPIARLLKTADTSPELITWGDIFALEAAYLEALPDDRLETELLAYRTRYRRVAGNDAYDFYMKSLPPGPQDAVAKRAELLALSDRIQYQYTFVSAKEATRNRVAQVSALLTFGFFGVAQAISAWLTYGAKAEMPTILLVIFAGMLGGFISVQQRLQIVEDLDPLLNQLQLEEGAFSVAILAPVSGAVFACALYWLFLGGLLHTDIFPSFGDSAKSLGLHPYKAFIEVGSAPQTTADYGKLLVWSFVAGFAERFVPDVLTRLAGQAAGPSAKQPTS